MSTIAVGHPISDGLIGKKYTGNNSKTIVLIPGSRMSEAKRLLPLMRDVAHQIYDENTTYKFIVPVVETTRQYITNAIKNWNVPVKLVGSEARYDVYSDAFVAIAASGTISAELAMMHVPAIIVYKMNPITIWLVRQFIRVRWVSLVNILLNRGVYPELLGPDATIHNVIQKFHELTKPNVRKGMMHELSLADNLWQKPNGIPAKIIAHDLMK